jgi:hypothetical protein
MILYDTPCLSCVNDALTFLPLIQTEFFLVQDADDGHCPSMAMAIVCPSKRKRRDGVPAKRNSMKDTVERDWAQVVRGMMNQG